MAIIVPPSAALIRFQQNEARMDLFANGTALQTWTTSAGTVLPTLAKFLADRDAEINAITGIAVTARDVAVAAKDTAVAARNTTTAARDQAVAAQTDVNAVYNSLVPVPLTKLSKAVGARRSQRAFMREFIRNDPHAWPDFAAAKTATGATNFYSSTIRVDKAADLMFILYMPDAGPAAMVIRKWSTGEYLRYVLLGPIRGWFGIYREGTKIRAGTAYGGSSINQFAYFEVATVSGGVVTLPTNGSTLAPVATNTLPAYVYGMLHKGIWTINDFTDGTSKVTKYIQYDTALNRLGFIEFPLEVSGSLVTGVRDLFPHMQDFSRSGNDWLMVYGGRWRKDGSDGLATRIPVASGVRRVSPDGQTIVSDGLMRPDLMIAIMESVPGHGVCDRLENEGMWVDPDTGEIYTFWVTKATSDGGSDGLSIWKEESMGDNATDFSAAAFPLATNGKLPMNKGKLATENNKIINPVTGLEFVTFTELLDYFIRSQEQYMAFNQADVAATVLDLSGRTFGSQAIVQVYRNHDGRMTMLINGSGLGPSRCYSITGALGAWTQNMIVKPGFKATVSAAQTIVSATDTKVVFPVETSDNGGVYNPATSEFSPAYSGPIVLGARVQIQTGGVADAMCYIQIFKNGAGVDMAGRSIRVAANETLLIEYEDREAVVTDLYTVHVTLNGTGDKTLYGSSIRCAFWGHHID